MLEFNSKLTIFFVILKIKPKSHHLTKNNLKESQEKSPFGKQKLFLFPRSFSISSIIKFYIDFINN